MAHLRASGSAVCARRGWLATGGGFGRNCRMHSATARSRALVLFSGGQDSTTCLAWALQRYPYVETIGFAYGQRHRVELDCRARIIEGLREMNRDWADKLGADHVLDLGVLGAVSDTALT